MKNINIRKDITFFYTDGVEYQTCKPIAIEAQKRGYSVTFSNDIKQNAEIGIYCQHVSYPKHSKLSLIMFHDISQGHGRWPNIWIKEPWDIYDIGIIPGPNWEERWKESSYHPFAHPKIGVIKAGWPKADKLLYEIGSDNSAFKSKYNISDKFTILYAPSWENDGKQDDFVQQLMNLDVELLLKHAPWSNEYSHIIENIRIMNDRHMNIAPNVHIIDRDEDIFDCLNVADLIVSEESGVMFEGLLLLKPSIAVTDWLIPDVSPERFPEIPYDFVVKTKKSNLKESVIDVINNYQLYKDGLKEYRDKNFYISGSASVKILDIIDKVLASTITSDDFVDSTRFVIFPIKDIINRYYHTFRHYVGNKLKKLNFIK